MRKSSGTRLAAMIVIIVILGVILAGRLVQLQIVHGSEYQAEFEDRIKKSVSIEPERGIIYDRNGKELAYNTSSYNLTLRDVSDSEDTGSNKLSANDSIYEADRILRSNGDSISAEFGITLNEYGDYQFTSDEDTAQKRFLADIYGYQTIDELSEEEKNKTPTQVINDLKDRYDVDLSGKGLSENDEKQYTLDVINSRYQMSLNSYQKYISATIATNISDESVSAIQGETDQLSGIEVEKNTVRQYADAKYFSNIIGYVGEISESQLEEAGDDSEYASGDIVGKTGLENSQNDILFGKKGSRRFSVDSMGTQIDSTVEVTEATSGNNIYLTIDADLQKAAYDILEKNMASLILERLIPDKQFTITSEMDNDQIYIPIYDVYGAVFENIADLGHFTENDASSAEQTVYSAYQSYISTIHDWFADQLYYTQTPYNELDAEHRVYETFISSQLFSDGVIQNSKVDTTDWVYRNWSERQEITLTAFLLHCVEEGWVDNSKLNLSGDVTNRDTIFNALYDYIDKIIDSDSFAGNVYHYMLINDVIDPSLSCQILMDQGLVTLSDEETAMFENGWEDSYTFMYNRISNLELTPAQLHLYPYAGSMVITDVNSGDVLAMVSYPGYDNNRVSNGADPDYYAKLQSDESLPMLNYATQQTTPPGSTFKIVTATAGLMEDVITPESTMYCYGEFTKIDPSPSCWYAPGHGEIALESAITQSCNMYFYNVGYRLGMKNGTFKLSDADAQYWTNLDYTYEDHVSDGYDADAGAERLAKYAEMYGLGTKSGVETEESSPNLPTTDAVRAAIGQSDNAYSTAGLSKYIGAIANSGTVYQLTLIDKIEDSQTGEQTENEPKVENTFDMSEEYWNTIHAGMRGVVTSKDYFSNLPVEVAGKTGTAQAGRAPSHALFLCYAPYSSPEISVATRITNGYSSVYASQITEKVLEYYYGVSTLDELTGSSSLQSSANYVDE